MSQKHDSAAHETSKPCVCKVLKRSSLVWKATGRTNAQNEMEFQCKICGATAWRPA